MAKKSRKKSSKSGSAVEPPAQALPALQEGGKNNAINRFLYWEQLRGEDQGPQDRRRFLVASASAVAPPAGAPPPPTPPGGPGSVNWTPIGPSVVGRGQATGDPPVSGRITGLAAAPGGTRVYAGAANGGVWLTEDAGNTWTPLDDYFVTLGVPPNLQADSLAVGAVAVQFGASAMTDIVYVGTGEANRSLDSYLGVGVRRCAAGVWSLEATNLAGTWVGELIIDPDNPDNVYAASGFGFYQRPPGGGADWTKLVPTSAPPSSIVSDIAVASTGPELRYYVAYEGGGVYAYDPNANSWTALTGIPTSPGLRIALSATRVPGGAANQRVVYALTQAGGLFRLAPGATNFTAVKGVPPVLPGTQGWYNIAIAIEPGTADTVWLVGDWALTGGHYNLSLWRGAVTTAGTPNFGFTNVANPPADPTYRGSGVHADGHAISFPPGIATPVWVGCDGGVFSSPTGTADSFQPCNVGLAITELTFFAQWPTTDAITFSGSQDNGTVCGRAEPSWYQAQRGDGGGVAIDPHNPYNVMRQYVRAGTWINSLTQFSPGLNAATDGGQNQASWSGVMFPPVGVGPSNAQKTAANTENSHTEWYTPLATVFASDVGQTFVAFGTNRVWLSTDWGASWNTLSANSNPYNGGGTNLTQDVLDDPSPAVPINVGGFRMNAVQALSFANSRLLYACTGAGIWRFDRSGVSSWTKNPLPSTGLPADRRITDIEVADATAGAVYVTIAGRPSSHVYYFPGDGAASWVDCNLTSGGVSLDSPAHSVVVDPSSSTTLYVATDVGVFQGLKTDATTWTWNSFSQGLPQAAVVDLAIHQATRLLRAATHGRGMWEILLDRPMNVSDTELYMRVNTADTGRLTSGGQRYSWVEGHPDPTRQGFNVYHWMSPDIRVRRPSLAAPPVDSPPSFYDFTYNVGDYVDTNDVETIDPGADRVFVQVHNRGRLPIDGSDLRVLLLLTDAHTGLPALPANYATHIVGGDDPSTWVLPGSNWFIGDVTSPYQNAVGSVDARVSGVVSFNIDVASLGLPATHDHICATAFVTSISNADRLTATEPSLDVLTMQDRHVVHRNLHVVPAGSTPATGRAAPQMFMFDVRNPLPRKTTYILELRCTDQPFDLQIVAPKGAPITGATLRRVRRASLDNRAGQAWDRWRKALDLTLRRHATIFPGWTGIGRQTERWRMQKLAKLSALDWNGFYVTAGSPAGQLTVTLPPGGFVTLVAMWVPPAPVQSGYRTRLDVIQRRGRAIFGGSTYSLRVV